MTNTNYMNKENFIDAIKESLRSTLGDNFTIESQTVTKNNDITLTAIIIRDSATSIAPSIYIDDYYTCYRNGRYSIHNICDIILETYNCHKNDIAFDASTITDFASCRDHICAKLINKYRNATLLDDAPHIDIVDDLTAVFYILIDNLGNATASITVKNNLFSLWNITVEELYDIALINSALLLPAAINPLNSILMELLDDSYADSDDIFDIMESDSNTCPMYVISNSSKMYGASCILYPELLSQCCEKLRTNSIIILPSSVHECIILPASDDMDASFLKEMVHEVNTSSVSETDYLSDNVFIYNHTTTKLQSI